MKTNSKKVIGFLKELFFPTATCYLCGSELDGTGECLCESCESGLKKIPDYEIKYKGLTVYSYVYYDELSKEIVLQCKDNNKSHCAEIEATAKRRMDVILPQLMKYYGVTEQLKAENQIEWVRQMNACVAQAEEAIKG